MGSRGACPEVIGGAGGCRPFPDTRESALRTRLLPFKGFPVGDLNDHEEQSFPGGDATA